jgi:ParB family chromosome partitioning protein
MFKLALDRVLDNPYQTRISYDTGYIRELAKDIASRARTRPGTRGLLQVPLARVVDSTGHPVESDVFTDFLGVDVTDAFRDQDLYAQLAFGHNRLRAFRLLAGETDTTPIELGISINDSRTWRRFPVEYAHLTDEEMATAAWTENSQRKDLSPLEEARALQRALDQFGWTQTRLSEEWGLAASTISNKRRLLRLPDFILEALDAGEISERQAAAFLPLYDLPQDMLEDIINTGSSWRQPENILDKARSGSSSDWVRNRIDTIIENSSSDLSDEWARAMMEQAFDDEDVRSNLCEECDALLPGPRCGDALCFNRKLSLWQSRRLEEASAATGLPILPDDHDSLDLNTFWLDDDDFIRGIVEDGCDCLHLQWAGQGWRSAGYHLDDDLDDVRVVCWHPGKIRCECRASRKAAKTREENANDTALEERRESERKTARLVGRANDALATALKDGDAAAWLLVLHALNTGTRGMGYDWNLDKVASKIATYSLRHLAGLRWTKDQPEKSRERIDEKFEQYGLSLPWDHTDDGDGGNGRAYTAEEVLNNRELLSKVRDGKIEVEGLEEALDATDRN